MELTIKTPSIKNLRTRVTKSVTSVGNAVLDAKTPSLREIGATINGAQKAVRNKVARVIDAK